MSADWSPAEPEEIIATFAAMLRAATGDGATKRQAGTKPSWKVDTSHEGAIFSHVCKWKRGEKADADSGAHPLVHAAWRCLAIAWQEMQATAYVPCVCVARGLVYSNIGPDHDGAPDPCELCDNTGEVPARTTPTTEPSRRACGEIH